MAVDGIPDVFKLRGWCPPLVQSTRSRTMSERQQFSSMSPSPSVLVCSQLNEGFLKQSRLDNRGKPKAKYSVRSAMPEDLPAIRDLALHGYFSAGLHNFTVFYQSSPVGWQVAEDEHGTIVAYYIYNQLPVGNIRFGYQLLVHPAHAGRGITNMFNMPKKDGVPVVANVTSDTIQRYQIDNWYDKVLCYVGNARPHEVFERRPPTVTNVNLQEVTDDVMEAIYRYDRQMNGFDRKHFLRLWLQKDKFGRSVVALQGDGTVRGFGTLKTGENYTMVAPLYADDDQVAYALFYQLLHDYGSCFTVSLYFLASNRFMCHFANKLGLYLFDSEMRITRCNCEAVVKKLQMKRVYALHEFWPI